jgi:hypothetical protein
MAGEEYVLLTPGRMALELLLSTTLELFVPMMTVCGFRRR